MQSEQADLRRWPTCGHQCLKVVHPIGSSQCDQRPQTRARIVDFPCLVNRAQGIRRLSNQRRSWQAHAAWDDWHYISLA